jgi:GNAT superfamily N-acetyltransferase
MQRIDKATIERGERAEIAAWASVWDAAPPESRAALKLSSERAGGSVVLRAAGFPRWFMNRIIGLGVDTPADMEWLAGQIERFRAAGTPFGVCLCREAEPEGLADWLTGRGLENGSALAKMIRRTNDLPSQDLSVNIREVGVEDARLFGEVGVRGYGLPEALTAVFGALPGTEGWRTYLAFEAGEPVGTGAIFVRGDVAWLGFGAVMPDHRRKGIHGALMLHRMHAAADLGCRWLVTETDLPQGDEAAPSFHNMQRLGFELAYDRPNYLSTQ